jgi:hypothetical protein
MELAAHWHRCQNLPKKRVTTSLLYKERDDPVKDGFGEPDPGRAGSGGKRHTGTLHGRTGTILATWQKVYLMGCGFSRKCVSQYSRFLAISHV